MVPPGIPQVTGDQDQIRSILRQITSSWLNGGIHASRELFHEKAVIVRPDFQGRVEGRDLCLRSYEDFTKKAVVKKYDESDHQIDLCGNTAVATYRFDIAYSMGGREFHEIGRDVFVFIREGKQWQVLWRTMVLISKDVRERSITV
jgi:hypothetical protein